MRWGEEERERNIQRQREHKSLALPRMRAQEGSAPPCTKHRLLETPHLPIGTAASVLTPEPVRKSPTSVGLSYTHGGKTGRRWPEFFLFCLSRSNFLVSSRDW